MKHVAITKRVELIENINERRDALSQEWSELANVCGFVPIFIPNNKSTLENIKNELSIDAIILTGGNDLAAYGGNVPERDEVETNLIEFALRNDIPLLGVCRGAQMLLHYFGTILEKVDGHVRTEHILTSGKYVNSYHGFAAKIISECLDVVEKSEDGIVEEFAHKKYSNIYGIMWHPERYKPFRNEDIEFLRRKLKL